MLITDAFGREMTSSQANLRFTHTAPDFGGYVQPNIGEALQVAEAPDQTNSG